MRYLALAYSFSKEYKRDARLTLSVHTRGWGKCVDGIGRALRLFTPVEKCVWGVCGARVGERSFFFFSVEAQDSPPSLLK